VLLIAEIVADRGNYRDPLTMDTDPVEPVFIV
jgi:hypothetical protein